MLDIVSFKSKGREMCLFSLKIDHNHVRYITGKTSVFSLKIDLRQQVMYITGKTGVFSSKIDHKTPGNVHYR